MDVLSATSAIVGLAVPVFQSAKALRDRIKLVCYPPHPLSALKALIATYIRVYAGRIGEIRALGSTRRIREGYKPPRVTLQQQQGTVGPTEPRHGPEGACRVRLALIPVRGGA